MITPVRHAVRFGLLLGLYFVVKYICFMYALSIPLLGVIYLVATLFVPYWAYQSTKNYSHILPNRETISLSVWWAHGTLLYAFATIIVLPTHYYFYTEALPNQLPLVAHELEALYNQAPELRTTFADLYGGAPMEVLQTCGNSYSVGRRLWMDFISNIFWGSLLSLISAILLHRNIKA